MRAEMELTVKMRGKHLFTWEGDAVALDKLRNSLPALAPPGIEPGAFAVQVAARVGKSGLPKDDTQRRGTMSWLIYLVVESETNHPDHPGKYADYVGAWDFEFDLRPGGPGRCEIQVIGGPDAAGIA
jgi:hypothetical protein